VDEDIVIPIAGMLMVIVLALGIPLVVAYVRRAGQREPSPVRDSFTDERLDRIEHAIDAMAVEVERIAEGQRFVTRLLSERTPEPMALPANREIGSRGGPAR
jgi:hypothetical protein